GRVGLRGPRDVSAWDALVEQERRGSHGRIGRETPLPNPLTRRVADAERVIERDETHRDMMAHVRAYDRDALILITPRVIERVVEAVGAECSVPLEFGEIVQRLVGIDRER